MNAKNERQLILHLNKVWLSGLAGSEADSSYNVMSSSQSARYLVKGRVINSIGRLAFFMTTLPSQCRGAPLLLKYHGSRLEVVNVVAVVNPISRTWFSRILRDPLRESLNILDVICRVCKAIFEVKVLRHDTFDGRQVTRASIS